MLFFTLKLCLLIFLNVNITDVVIDYHEVKSKEMEVAFITKYQNNKSIDIQAYVVSLKMKQAKYKWFPWQKIKEFNTHKSTLESLIKKYPKNIHLRYIRLVIQEKVPRLLNYFNDIEADKMFLQKMLNSKDKTDYLNPYIIKNTSL